MPAMAVDFAKGQLSGGSEGQAADIPFWACGELAQPAPRKEMVAAKAAIVMSSAVAK